MFTGAGTHTHTHTHTHTTERERETDTHTRMRASGGSAFPKLSQTWEGGGPGSCSAVRLVSACEGELCSQVSVLSTALSRPPSRMDSAGGWLHQTSRAANADAQKLWSEEYQISPDITIPAFRLEPQWFDKSRGLMEAGISLYVMHIQGCSNAFLSSQICLHAFNNS